MQVKIRLDVHHAGFFRIFSRIFKERSFADLVRCVFVFFFFLLHLGSQRRDGTVYF